MSTALHSGGGIRLFIGECIEHASDRDILVTVCDALNKDTEWAYIFANFNVSGRQVDVAIFTATTTLVIEAKGYTQPVKGGVNGSWTQIGPYGSRTRKLWGPKMRCVMSWRAYLAILPAIPTPCSPLLRPFLPDLRCPQVISRCPLVGGMR